MPLFCWCYFSVFLFSFVCISGSLVLFDHLFSFSINLVGDNKKKKKETNKRIWKSRVYFIELQEERTDIVRIVFFLFIGFSEFLFDFNVASKMMLWAIVSNKYKLNKMKQYASYIEAIQREWKGIENYFIDS